MGPVVIYPIDMMVRGPNRRRPIDDFSLIIFLVHYEEHWSVAAIVKTELRPGV